METTQIWWLTPFFCGMHGTIVPGRGHPSNSFWMAFLVHRCTRQQHGSIRRLAIPGIAAAAMLGSITLPAVAQPLVGILPSESMNIDTAGVVVTGSSNAWRITAPMRDDNGNASLGTSFRRWWHFQVEGLNAAAGSTLAMSITKSGYSDIITPVWSLDGGLT